MKLTRSANIIEVDVNGRKYSKVNYSDTADMAFLMKLKTK